LLPFYKTIKQPSIFIEDYFFIFKKPNMLRSMIRLSLLIVLCYACNNQTADTTKTDSGSSADHTSTTLDKDSSRGGVQNTNNADSDFAVKASMGNMAEVVMGKLAVSRGNNPRVKDFGAMMVRDHSQAGDQLRQIAQTKNIPLPGMLNQEEQKHVNDLQKMSGSDFDKMYMDMMLDDHKDDIKEFKKAGSDCKDADLKNFAVTTLPVLEKHLDSAKAITGK
jgi:putative membrane protein